MSYIKVDFANDYPFADNVYDVRVGDVVFLQGADYFTAVEIADEWMAAGFDAVIELSQEEVK